MGGWSAVNHVYVSRYIIEQAMIKLRGEISSTYNNKTCPADNKGGMEGGEWSREAGKKGR